MNSCVNPFAPNIDENLGSNEGLISNQTDIGGVFQNFQYAYTFKDTLIYSQIIHKDFIFIYTDYTEEVVKVKTWGKEEEIKYTYGLFQNSQRLDLIWNNIVSMTSDSTHVVRSFDLTVTFNPTDINYVNGRVNLTLIKENNKWKILRWVDESSF